MEETEELAPSQSPFSKGEFVEVVKGIKFPLGMNGKIFWVAPTVDRYGVTKIGFVTEGEEKVFINQDNVRSLDNE